MQCQLHWSSNDGDVWVHVTSNYFLKYFLFEKKLNFFLKKINFDINTSKQFKYIYKNNF